MSAIDSKRQNITTAATATATTTTKATTAKASSTMQVAKPVYNTREMFELIAQNPDLAAKRQTYYEFVRDLIQVKSVVPTLNTSYMKVVYENREIIECIMSKKSLGYSYQFGWRDPAGFLYNLFVMAGYITKPEANKAQQLPCYVTVRDNKIEINLKDMDLSNIKSFTIAGLRPRTTLKK